MMVSQENLVRRARYRLKRNGLVLHKCDDLYFVADIYSGALTAEFDDLTNLMEYIGLLAEEEALARA